MKKIIGLLIVLFGILFAVVYLVRFSNNSQSPKLAGEQSTGINVAPDSSLPKPATQNRFVPYKNASKGFSLMLPASVAYSKMACMTSVEVAGKPPEAIYAEVPLTVLEDGNKFYITPEFRLGMDAESTPEDTCQRIVPHVEEIRRYFNGEEGGEFTGWRVTIDTVADRARLDSYVKNLFDHNCRIDQMNFDSEKQLFDVTVAGINQEQADCFIDYEVYFKYSKDHGKIAILEGAQDCVFPDVTFLMEPDQSGSDEFYNEHCLDVALVKSFRFE